MAPHAATDGELRGRGYAVRVADLWHGDPFQSQVHLDQDLVGTAWLY
jgi:redox-regulated HSP33 family molecular chaperone